MKVARMFDMTLPELVIGPRTRWLHPYGVVLIAYILATRFTDAYFMGDTWIYVSDMLKAKSLGANFWDFGHALWRPFGWLVSGLFYPLDPLGIGEDRRAHVTFTLLGINWVAGLISALLVHALASRFSNRRWVAYFITAVFLSSNAILNYAQTAQPYVPGISLLLLGLYILVRDGETPSDSRRTALWAGTALAGGVCLWVPLVLSIPVMFVCPLFLFGSDKSRLRLALQTGLVFALVVTFVYASMIINLGIHDMAGLTAWIGAATHGVLPDSPLKAIQRMVFAFARNFIHMGNDGRLFKQYIVHDVFNPVSLPELFRFALWKLIIFYLFLLSLVINLLSSTLGRRTLALLLLNALPVAVFAVFLFESGSIDRYLPLFPVLFLTLSVALGGDTSPPGTRYIALLFLVAATISNVSAMSTMVLNRQQEQVVARIRDLEPLLRPESRVVTINQQDEVYAFNQNFPFNPINRAGHLDADILVDPGTTQIVRWQQIFSTKTLSLWDRGGDVWITKRVLHQRPGPEWNWVEGDDPRLSWTDIYAFFSRIEMGQSVGGQDGFVLVSPSPQNRRFLSRVAQNT